MQGAAILQKSSVQCAILFQIIPFTLLLSTALLLSQILLDRPLCIGKLTSFLVRLIILCIHFSALSPKVVTGDETVDALISAKLARISECGITFRMDGVIDGGLNWKPMDICTVFANLLDNAIEAAANTENGFIDLEFKKSEHHRLIRASNNCAEELDCDALMLSDRHFTSKQDKALHGYGIGNIRKTVEKNGGMMKISCAEHVFTMEIILPRNL